MPTATKPKTKQIAFRSGCPNLLVVRVPEDEIMLSQGGKQKIKGTSYQFNNHVLVVREGTDILPDGNDPDTGEPVQQDAVDYLRNLAATLDPSAKEWFEEEQPPIPPSSEAITEILQATIARDAQRLAEILDAERETHQREDVISAAMDAFEALDRDESGAKPEDQELAD